MPPRHECTKDGPRSTLVLGGGGGGGVGGGGVGGGAKEERGSSRLLRISNK